MSTSAGPNGVNASYVPYEDGAAAAEPFPALYPWLETQARDALQARARWPHALMLEGAQGIGKRVLALHFARALLCEEPASDGTACGTCPSCRYVAAGQHPDLRIVEPVEIDEDGTPVPVDFVKIDRIRELTAWAQVTSHRRIAKVAVIAPAERMNAPAANALLKTLEEPPPRTNLILVAHQPGRLPITIASRCRRIVVPMPAREAAERWLETLGVEESGAMLAQAGGAPLDALRLANRALQDERAAWLRALAAPDDLSAVALAARLDLAGRDERRDRLAAAIDWLIAWTADLARLASGGKAERNIDREADLAKLAPRVARISLLRYHQELLQQRALLAHPLQPRLVAEALLLDYRTLFR
jgi:DNA polymerase-3 subunit delta'